jgi:hypothetical protein
LFALQERAGHKISEPDLLKMMLRFKLPVLSLLLGSATAAAGGGMSRRLQFADIVGFTPLTDVRDQVSHAHLLCPPYRFMSRSFSVAHTVVYVSVLQLRIDLDQQKIEDLLAEQSTESFAEAQRMYQEGAFSKTVSDLTVAGLPVEIPQGTKLVGSSGNSTDTSVSTQQVTSVEVFAYAAEGYPEGATSIRVQYVNEGCYVGANPDPVTEGCKSNQINSGSWS